MFPVEKISSKDAKRIRYIIYALVIFCVLSVLFPVYNLIRYFFRDTGFYTHETSACIFLNLTGFPCAFCGMSRSFLGFVHFDIHEILYYNPSAVVLFPAGAVVLLVVFFLSLKNYRLKIKYDKKFWLFIAGVIIIEWAVNIMFGHQ